MARGVVKLPEPLADVTVDHRVYTEVMDEGNRWVVFKVWRGKHENFVGFLHIATPIDIYTHRSADEYTPDHYVGRQPLFFNRKIDDHWYVVSFQLD